MDISFSILLILGALLVAAASPGPSFVLVAKVSMGASRNDGIAASLGMGIGAVIFSILVLMGLHTILTNIPMLYFSFKILGGCYLVYIGFRIFKQAKKTLNIENKYSFNRTTFKKSFLLGFLTQTSNPKTAIVYGTIFASLLPSAIPNSVYYILPLLVFIVETSWYLVVTFTLSTSSPRAIYLRSKTFFDRIAGTILAGIGIKLLLSTKIP